MISLVCGSTQSYLSVRDRCREANTTKATLVQGTDACCCLSFYLLGGEWAGRRGGLRHLEDPSLPWNLEARSNQTSRQAHQHLRNQPVLHVLCVGKSNDCAATAWVPGGRANDEGAGGVSTQHLRCIEPNSSMTADVFYKIVTN